MIEALEAALAADCPALLWGAPGTGKTAALQALAWERGATLRVLSAEDAARPDWAGIVVPDMAARRAVTLAPDWAHDLRAALDDGGRPAWLFLDELTAWPRSARAQALCLVQSREIAGIDLDGIRIVAAANPPDLGEDCAELGASSANRWVHLSWEPSAAAWAAGMRAGWGDPQSPAVASSRALIARYVLSTLAAPERTGDVPPLLVVPRDYEALGEAWPSPRSWDAAARLLAVAGDPRHDAAQAAIGGAVGRGAAETLLHWIVEQDLPDPEAVLADADGPLPDRIDRLTTTVESVAAAAVAEHEERVERYHAAWAVLGRVPRDVALSGAGILCRARRRHHELGAVRLCPLALELDAVLRAAESAS